MKYSSLVILTRMLKMLTLQLSNEDSEGISQQNKQFILCAACILAANRCDNNISGKCIYPKNLINSTFIAMTYYNIVNEQDFDLNEQWNQKYHDYVIKMFNLVNQKLDMNLNVIYPIQYISNAMSDEYPHKAIFINQSRYTLNDPYFFFLIEQANFQHPRIIAKDVFEVVVTQYNDHFNGCISADDI